MFRYINWAQKCIRYSIKVLQEVKVTVQQYDTRISAPYLCLWTNILIFNAPFVQISTFETCLCKMYHLFKEFMSLVKYSIWDFSQHAKSIWAQHVILWLRYRCVISCTKHVIKNRAWIRWKVLSNSEKCSRLSTETLLQTAMDYSKCCSTFDYQKYVLQ